MAITIKPPRLQTLYWDAFPDYTIKVLRLDEVHPVVSGNKWFKLQFYLQDALDKSYKTILSFGGGWSNHLLALAAACNELGLNSVGVVRGQYEVLTPTLKHCQALGMVLHFKEKTAYATYKSQPYDYVSVSDYYVIPEGGDGVLGVQGAATIASYIPANIQHVCLSVGSGTTMAGILNAVPNDTMVHGFAPMKGGSYLRASINKYLPQPRDFMIYDQWHGGGFGKYDDDLLAFIQYAEQTWHLPLDVVYTAKMMRGIAALLQAGQWAADENIVIIHTGGLQGNASI